MPRIVVITHRFDKFDRRAYILTGVLEEVAHRGVVVQVTRGYKRFVPADLAILHVDNTELEPDYRTLASRYPRSLNSGVMNIGKRAVSGALLARDSAWNGPVIVKTELNAMGAPELFHNQVAILRRRPLPHPKVTALGEYVVHQAMRDVPDGVWRDPSRVVEKFIPESDPRGFAMRTWVFMGARERCTRNVAPRPMIKAADVIVREPVDVPDELRAERRRLGFDFGKFDFVMHAGKAVLLDANPTPTAPENLSDEMRRGAKDLAEGLLELL
jgi:hypothetical protein